MKARDLAVSGLFTAIMAVLSQISIPLPISPVPISLGVLGVYLASGLQRPTGALLSMGAYLILGAVGLPVFANFQGGLGALLGPTGGFLLAYPLMALVVSLGAKLGYSKGRLLGRVILAFSMAFSMVICYGLGAAWLAVSRELALSVALNLAAWPFIPGDIIKIVLAAALLPILRRRLTGLMNR